MTAAVHHDERPLLTTVVAIPVAALLPPDQGEVYVVPADRPWARGRHPYADGRWAAFYLTRAGHLHRHERGHHDGSIHRRAAARLAAR